MGPLDSCRTRAPQHQHQLFPQPKHLAGLAAGQDSSLPALRQSKTVTREGDSLGHPGLSPKHRSSCCPSSQPQALSARKQCPPRPAACYRHSSCILWADPQQRAATSFVMCSPPAPAFPGPDWAEAAPGLSILYRLGQKRQSEPR